MSVAFAPSEKDGLCFEFIGTSTAIVTSHVIASLLIRSKLRIFDIRLTIFSMLKLRFDPSSHSPKAYTVTVGRPQCERYPHNDGAGSQFMSTGKYNQRFYGYGLIKSNEGVIFTLFNYRSCGARCKWHSKFPICLVVYASNCKCASDEDLPGQAAESCPSVFWNVLHNKTMMSMFVYCGNVNLLFPATSTTVHVV